LRFKGFLGALKRDEILKEMNFNELKEFCQIIGTFGIPKINKIVVRKSKIKIKIKV
jgi:hypothetical protein